MIAGHWDVVVVGARIAGAATAWALAPYAKKILVVDASQATSFWPQQSTWDRDGALLWADLGLHETVLACGAPPTYGHTFRADGEVTEQDYPRQDAYSYRMTAPREVLDPALLRAAQSRNNVTVLRPARVRDIAIQGGRVQGVTVRHQGAEHPVSCDLLVLADGRLSRNADRVGAVPYQVIPSPWVAMLAYFADLPLPSDRGYICLQRDNVAISTPCGPRQWCVSTDMHQAMLDASGRHPAQEFARIIAEDPHLGPAVAAGRRISPVGGAGKLRMQRRPMSGPGWCLVGDAGYHLDPVVARGTKAALVAAQLLRDRVAAAGEVRGAILEGLTEQRDAAMQPDWELAEQACLPAPSRV
ncbi:MAG TPA: FAD-dependent monooxygenase [Jatrophihabitans sp.]|jgi:2-polyprenyl-6-methoxyphenol hydroxylase-like FAD-dependent oxidoreductase|uniref:NAD(P)/FAD-dependent oxidoreductase n=1 Tax=Jatrophihabitans sp. TaxID=1932789 RepID=UPI002EDBC1F1